MTAIPPQSGSAGPSPNDLMFIETVAPVHAQLEHVCSACRDTLEAETLASIDKAHETGLLKDGARWLREATNTYAAKRQAILDNPSLTLQGKQLALDEIAAARDAAFQKVLDTAATSRDALLAKQQGPSGVKLTTDVAAEGTLKAALWDKMAASDRLQEVTDLLQLANDARTPAAEAYRANQLLQHVYGPLVKRSAATPAHYERGLVETAERLSRLIEAHLANKTGQVAYETAKGHADGLHRQLHNMADMARTQGTWDDFMQRTVGHGVIGGHAFGPG